MFWNELSSVTTINMPYIANTKIKNTFWIDMITSKIVPKSIEASEMVHSIKAQKNLIDFASTIPIIQTFSFNGAKIGRYFPEPFYPQKQTVRCFINYIERRKSSSVVNLIVSSTLFELKIFLSFFKRSPTAIVLVWIWWIQPARSSIQQYWKLSKPAT